MRSLRKIASGMEELAHLVSSGEQVPGACVLCPWREDLAAVLQARLQPGAVVPVPPPLGAPEDFAVAHGAVLGLDDGDQLTLRSPALERRMAVKTWRRTFFHVAALVVALAALGASLDHRRTATLRALDARISALQEEAAPVLDLRNEVASVAELTAVVSGEASDRMNPLDVLLALTRILPEDAYVTQLSVSGDSWELNGYARDAAKLVPLLERSDLFADVRFRTATTRTRIGDRSLENFSLAFHHVPTT